MKNGKGNLLHSLLSTLFCRLWSNCFGRKLIRFSLVLLPLLLQIKFCITDVTHLRWRQHYKQGKNMRKRVGIVTYFIISCVLKHLNKLFHLLLWVCVCVCERWSSCTWNLNFFTSWRRELNEKQDMKWFCLTSTGL